MPGSVPSIQTVEVEVGDMLRLHHAVPIEILIATKGGSEIRIVMPANGTFEIIRGTDIVHFSSRAVSRRGLRVVGDTQDD